MEIKARGLLAAVLHVPDNGMPRLAEMDADLVLASGLQRHLHERRAVFDRDLLPFRAGELGSIA